MIRRTARPGDWILGITPKEDGHRLAYAAQVSKGVSGATYYQKYGRKDQIYRIDKNGRFKLRHKKIHDARNFSTDIGKPPSYNNARILLSKRFWYYGENAKPLNDFGEFPYTNAKLKRLGQGHRVHHHVGAREELEKLIERISKKPSGRLGRPRHRLRVTCDEDVASPRHGKC